MVNFFLPERSRWHRNCPRIGYRNWTSEDILALKENQVLISELIYKYGFINHL